MVDIPVLNPKFGLPDNPERDDYFIALLSKAKGEQLPVYFGAVAIDRVVPFCSVVPDRKKLDQVKVIYYKNVIDRKPPYLHVYPKDDVFIMSDDYYAYYFYKETNWKKVPCLIFGRSDSKYISYKKEIDWQG